ncbi:MAG: outer membrane lipoprotein chaperone LolA [Wenzhouxiangella sp.]
MWKTSLLLPLAVMVVVTAEASDSRDQLDAFAAGLESLSGGFEQITIDESGRVTEEAEGRLYFRTPDYFRWDYHAPFPQEMVADGEKLWHYDESLDQVTVRDQPDADESPLMVIMRPERLERFYRIRDAGDPDVLEFVPRGDNAEFEQARLHFRNGVPRMLELEDRFGQLTRVMLNDLSRNPRLEEGLFNFTLPSGVDVLEGY